MSQQTQVPQPPTNILSKCFFLWVTPLLKLGVQEPIAFHHLAPLPVSLTTEKNGQDILKLWQEINTHPRSNTSSLLVTTIRRLYHNTLWWTAFMRLSYCLFQISFPLFIQLILYYLSNPILPMWTAYVLAGMILLIQAFFTLVYQHYWNIMSQMSLKVLSGTAAMLYDKLFKLSTNSKITYDHGKIMNMFTNDIQMLSQAIAVLHEVWCIPLQLLMMTGVLVYLLGPCVLLGGISFIIAIPLQTWISGKLGLLWESGISLMDKRVNLMQTILRNMRLIKINAWEQIYLDKVDNIRQKELHYAFQHLVYQSLFISLAVITPAMTMMISYSTFVAFGNVLTPEIVFTSLAVFNGLLPPLSNLPAVITRMINAKIAIQRMELFLLCEEQLNYVRQEETTNSSHGIIVNHGYFSWNNTPSFKNTNSMEDNSGIEKGARKEDSLEITSETEIEMETITGFARDTSQERMLEAEEENGNGHLMLEIPEPHRNSTIGSKKEGSESSLLQKCTLQDICLSIPKGSLVAIMGSVGSGKTTLLHGILGQLVLEKGSVSCLGSVAYCSQIPWIENATIENNILSHSQKDNDTYAKVLDFCSLKEDVSSFPAGDQTMVGERGVQLSGGQKHRVSLARALYSQCDIILMDDFMSSLDARVSNHIFFKCIVEAMRGKTRLLVTHRFSILSHFDYIVCLEDKRIKYQGSYDFLMENQEEFKQCILNVGDTQLQNLPSPKHQPPEPTTLEIDAEVMGEEVEDRLTGPVTFRVYWYYLKLAGGPKRILLLSVALALLTQATRIGSDVWLLIWTQSSSLTSGWNIDIPNIQFIAYYGVWMLSQGLTGFLYGIIFATIGIKVSKKLHELMLSNIIHAPCSFFDTTPSGRIINRCSTDIQDVDHTTVVVLQLALMILCITLTSLILIICIVPYYAIALPALVVVYIIIQRYYRSTVREMKRLTSVHYSFIFSHITETLHGLLSIKSYRLVSSYKTSFYQYLNDYIKLRNDGNLLEVWLQVRLEIMAAYLVFLAVVIILIEKDHLSPSMAGLALSYAFQITMYLNMCVERTAMAEMKMNAVERIMVYTQDVESEASFHNPNFSIPNIWPTEGCLHLENVTIRYRQDLPLVLNHITVSIQGRERIGIIGRTGSGKSTLGLALLRIMELSEGRIEMDGVNIAEVGLHDLRKAISLIPQDPSLMLGTIKENLDHFHNHSDEEIWKALEMVTMKETIAGLSLQLDTMVGSIGEPNFSTGQLQLLCIARAFLEQSKIVILDEATASLDSETHRQLEVALLTCFQSSTLLCIAHRLSGLLEYDKIMILEKGELVEFGSPKELLGSPASRFTKWLRLEGSLKGDKKEEDPVGFEPTTYRSAVDCSTTEL